MIYCASPSYDLDISVYCSRSRCASGLVKDFIWHNIIDNKFGNLDYEVGGMTSIMEKLLENIASSYMPRLRETSRSRADELLAIKEKIRSSPEEVELWFDNEIQKLRNIDFTSLLRIADSR